MQCRWLNHFEPNRRMQNEQGRSFKVICFEVSITSQGVCKSFQTSQWSFGVQQVKFLFVEAEMTLKNIQVCVITHLIHNYLLKKLKTTWVVFSWLWIPSLWFNFEFVFENHRLLKFNRFIFILLMVSNFCCPLWECHGDFFSCKSSYG